MTADATSIVREALARFRGGDLAGAERVLADGRRAAPRESEILRCQAWILAQTGRGEAALAVLDEAVRLDPASPMLWLDRGNLLSRAERFEEALGSYDRTNALGPNADAFFNRARVFVRLRRPDAAVAEFTSGLALRPEDPAALHQRGVALHLLGRVEDALADFDRALGRAPNDPDLATDRGGALYELGRREEAMAIFESVLARAPQHGEARRNRARGHYNEAMALLGRGEFAEGFRLYEHRREAGAIETPDYSRGQRAWRGERLSGVLHVWLEQGLGEELAFARFLPAAVERTPRVVLECEGRLEPLFRRAFPMLEGVQGHDAPIAGIEAQCAVASLPAILGLSGDALQPRSGYLKADPARVAAMRSAYKERAGGRPLIGLAWFSNNKTIGAQKSASLLEWDALLKERYAFVNLQYGDRGADIAAAQAAFGCEIFSDASVDQMTDLEAFAAQVAALDAVVSVSNTTVHMAGALGQRCLVLAPEPPALLWFWGATGEGPHWYESVRAVRRAPGEGWAEQVARAAAVFKKDLA